MKLTVIPVVIGTLGTVTKDLKEVGRVENWRTNRNYPSHKIVEIG